MRCEEIMKKNVYCVTENESVQAAARTMRDQGIGFLPVCEEKTGKVLGTITDRDIAIRAAIDDRPSGDIRVSEVMTREAVKCRPNEDLRKVEELMGKHHKSRVMVTDDKGKLLGVISLSDVAQRETHEQVARTMRAVSEREARKT